MVTVKCKLIRSSLDVFDVTLSSRQLPDYFRQVRSDAMVLWQVARIRHNVLTPAEQPRELTAADRQVLAENHKRRVAEIVTKQCAQALKHVQNHKVCLSRF